MTAFFLGPWLACVCYGIGRALVKSLKLELRRAEEAVFSLGAGMGILAYAVLALGLLGMLKTGALWALVLTLTVFVLLARLTSVRLKMPAMIHTRDLLFAGAALLAALPWIAGMLAPETANDSLCYHLHLPKLYLREGKIGTLPYEINSEFPLMMEMLYTLGAALGGVPLAKFFHILSAVLTAASIAVCIRKLAGRWVFALPLLFLTTPGVFNQAVTTYVDVALSGFTLLAVMAVIFWHQNPDKNRSLLALAGLFLGFALGVKYLALISAGFLGLWILGVSASRTPKRLFMNLAVFGGCIAAAGIYWYVRSWIVTGNPVYPYFAQIFGTGDATIHYNDIGLGKTLLNWFLVFPAATMRPDLFEGFSVQIGPGYLAFLPLFFLVPGKTTRTPLMLAAFCLFFVTAWFLLGQSLRFLLPALPALCVLIGLGWAALDSSIPARILKFLMAAVLLYQIGLSFYHSRQYLKAGLGMESEIVYLERVERSLQMANYVNGRLDSSSKILTVDDPHLLYFSRTVFREGAYARKHAYWQDAHNPQEVFRELRSQGITHLILAKNAYSEPPDSMPELRLPRLLRRGENQLATSLKPLYTYTFTDVEGLITQYHLYEIIQS